MTEQEQKPIPSPEQLQDILQQFGQTLAQDETLNPGQVIEFQVSNHPEFRESHDLRRPGHLEPALKYKTFSYQITLGADWISGQGGSAQIQVVPHFPE